MDTIWLHELPCNADIVQWIDGSTNAQKGVLFHILANPYISTTTYWTTFGTDSSLIAWVYDEQATKVVPYFLVSTKNNFWACVTVKRTKQPKQQISIYDKRI